MTTDEKTKHWDKMSCRPKDSWGAEHIMGWKRPEHHDTKAARKPSRGHSIYDFYWLSPDGNFTNQIPKYSTDASADYLILEKVASTWGPGGKGMFFESLGRILVQRHSGNDMNDMDEPSIDFIEYLKIGDYLKSAWLALTENE